MVVLILKKDSLTQALVILNKDWGLKNLICNPANGPIMS
jgi:hypothetical protein